MMDFVTRSLQLQYLQYLQYLQFILKTQDPSTSINPSTSISVKSGDPGQVFPTISEHFCVGVAPGILQSRWGRVGHWNRHGMGGASAEN